MEVYGYKFSCSHQLPSSLCCSESVFFFVCLCVTTAYPNKCTPTCDLVSFPQWLREKEPHQCCAVRLRSLLPGDLRVSALTPLLTFTSADTYFAISKMGPVTLSEVRAVQTTHVASTLATVAFSWQQTGESLSLTSQDELWSGT